MVQLFISLYLFIPMHLYLHSKSNMRILIAQHGP